MPSLVTDQEKIQYGNDLNNVFLSFVRPAIIWKDGNKINIASDPNTYNWIYGTAEAGVTFDYQPVSGVFDISISWGAPNNFNQGELRPNIDGGTCQIDMLDDAYNFLSGYNRIVVDGIVCEIDQNNPTCRPHGLFDVRYKNLVLRRVN